MSHVKERRVNPGGANDLFSLAERDQGEDSRAAKAFGSRQDCFGGRVIFQSGEMLSPSDSFTNPTDALKNIAEFPAEVVTLEEQKAKNRSGRR
jgi:hypothetical protein